MKLGGGPHVITQFWPASLSIRREQEEAMSAAPSDVTKSYGPFKI